MAALVGSELRRLTLLRTPVNKGKKKTEATLRLRHHLANRHGRGVTQDSDAPGKVFLASPDRVPYTAI
jgi:hypothetical protein